MKIILEWHLVEGAEEYLASLRGRCYRDGTIELMPNGTEELRQVIKNTPPRHGIAQNMMSLFGNSGNVAIVGTFDDLPGYW